MKRMKTKCRVTDQPSLGNTRDINTWVWEGPLQQVGRRASVARGTLGSFPYGGVTETADGPSSSRGQKEIPVSQGQLLKCGGTRSSKTSVCCCCFGGATDPEDITENIAGATDTNYHWRD